MLAPMRRSIQLLSVFLLLILASAVRAQTPLTCGIVGIDGPSEVDASMPIQFKVKITGMNHIAKPEFKWFVSLGTITMGQGTDEITIDTTGLAGMVLTATVALSGVPLGCTGEASITTQVKLPPIGCNRPFDEYGDIKFDDEKARLDNFAVSLSNYSSSIGYILMSAGQVTFEKEADERLARAKSYLVDVREIDRNQIVTVDCGFSQDLNIRLYIAPPGAAPPPCSNSEGPLSDVKFTKPRPKSAKKRS